MYVCISLKKKTKKTFFMRASFFANKLELSLP